MKIDKDLAGISLLILFTMTVWIFVESYAAYKNARYTGVTPEIALPIDPNLNFEGTGL